MTKQLPGQLALFGTPDEVVTGWQFPPGARLEWACEETNISWKEADTVVVVEPPNLDGLSPQERVQFDDEICNDPQCWCASPQAATDPPVCSGVDCWCQTDAR